MEAEKQEIKNEELPEQVPGEDVAEENAAKKHEETVEKQQERTYTAAEVEELLKRQRSIDQSKNDLIDDSDEGLDAENYGDAMSYAMALAKKKAEKAVGKLSAQEAMRHRVASFEQKISQYEKDYPDMRETINATVADPMVADVVNGVLECDNGPIVAYHLLKDDKLRRKLNRLSPYNQAIEIGKISQSYKQATATKAPAPLESVKSGSQVNGDLSKMSADDYIDFLRKKRYG